MAPFPRTRRQRIHFRQQGAPPRTGREHPRMESNPSRTRTGQPHRDRRQGYRLCGQRTASGQASDPVFLKPGWLRTLAPQLLGHRPYNVSQENLCSRPDPDHGRKAHLCPVVVQRPDLGRPGGKPQMDAWTHSRLSQRLQQPGDVFFPSHRREYLGRPDRERLGILCRWLRPG